MTSTEPVLTVEDLNVSFPTDDGLVHRSEDGGRTWTTQYHLP